MTCARDSVISAGLRERIESYEHMIFSGRATSLAGAVRLRAEEMLLQRERDRAVSLGILLAKRRIHEAQAIPVPGQSLRGYPCAYCGAPAAITVDHIVPKCQGGPDARWNMVPACFPCNNEKNGRTPAQWRARSVTWPPPSIPRHPPGLAELDRRVVLPRDQAARLARSRSSLP